MDLGLLDHVQTVEIGQPPFQLRSLEKVKTLTHRTLSVGLFVTVLLFLLLLHLVKTDFTTASSILCRYVISNHKALVY